MDLKLGLAALLLMPGLAFFAGFYGLLGGHSHRHSIRQRAAFTPIAPPPNSIKAALIILGGAVCVQGVTTAIILLPNAIEYLCGGTSFYIRISDPYDTLEAATHHPNSWYIFCGASIVLAQCVLAYLASHSWVKWRLFSDNAPRWLYGWAYWMAELADDGHLVIAVVLTDQDVAAAPPVRKETGMRSIVYSGPITDIALSSTGTIQRINIGPCVRYLVDMREDITQTDESRPLSIFDELSIEAPHIRNVTFKKIDEALFKSAT